MAADRGKTSWSALSIVALLLSSQLAGVAAALQDEHSEIYRFRPSYSEAAPSHSVAGTKAAHEHAVTQAVASVQQLGESIRRYDFSRDAETDGARWEEDTLMHSIVPYSALRDPVDSKIRVFFDAEPWLHGNTEECHFAKAEHVPSKYYDSNDFPARQEVEVPGKLISLHDNTRAFDGYILICEDPGPEYTQVVFRSHLAAHHHLLLSLTIEEVESEEQHVFGICSAPLFSKRIGFESWVHDSMRANITSLQVYFTALEPHAMNELTGVRWNKETWEPFEPLPLDGVQYFRYTPPLSRFYFSQSTLLNECMYRNRHAMRYIVIADADEFIHMQQPNITLEAAVESLMGDEYVSLLVDTLLYPRTCQAGSGEDLDDLPQNTSLTDFSHLFDANYPRFDYPKSIINPRRGLQFDVHSFKQVEEGFKDKLIVKEDVMFFKHIRIAGHCSEEYRASLASDQSPQHIQDYIHSGPVNRGWLPESEAS